MNNKIDKAIKIFVVIPVLDDPQSLRALLNNILSENNQKYLTEAVVVSGSESKEISWIVSEFIGEGHLVTLLNNPSRFTPHAINIGIKYSLSKGADIIQMLGAHSNVNDGYFSELIRIAETEKDVSIFSPCYDFFPAETMMERSIQLFHLSRLGRNWQKIFKISKPIQGFGSGAFAVRSSVFKKIGYFDERFIRNQDNEFFNRARKKGLKGFSYPGLVYSYKTRGSLKDLKKQNFEYGRYFALGPFSHSVKQAAPFLFYFALIMIIIFNALFYLLELPRFVLLGTALFMTTFGIYLSAIMIESLRQFIKNGAPAINLPSILIMMHFYYAMGSFKGFLFGFEKQNDNKKELP